MNSKNSDKDISNITYSATVSNLYDTYGKVRPFHREKYKPIIEYILEYFGKENLEKIKLLDVGIGYGAFLKLCEETGMKNLYGMDPFPNSINIAKKFTSADLRLGKIEDDSWPFEENYFGCYHLS